MLSISKLDGSCRAADGTSLFFRRWLPQEAPPKAVLLIVHGLAEHSGRYDELGSFLARRGKACYALDLRGHGRSDGLRIHVNSFADYDLDLAALLQEINARHPQPLAIIGHSMGGLLAIRATSKHAERLTATILSSPALAVHPSAKPPAVLQTLARLAAKLLPRSRFRTDLDASRISRDPKVVERYVRDPLVSHRASARWYVSFLQAQAEAFAVAPTIRTPMLVMQSAADRIVDPAATQRWARDAAVQSFRSWPGLYHEMFNEPEKKEVYQLVDTWLDEQLPSEDRT